MIGCGAASGPPDKHLCGVILSNSLTGYANDLNDCINNVTHPVVKTERHYSYYVEYCNIEES